MVIPPLKEPVREKKQLEQLTLASAEMVYLPPSSGLEVEEVFPSSVFHLYVR